MRTPKWIGLTLFLLVLTVAFAWLSQWQFDRATAQVAASRANGALPAPIADLVPATGEVPSGSLGRLVELEGRYVDHVWISSRASAQGEPGRWLVSALDDGSGSVTAVVRGWLPPEAELPGAESPGSGQVWARGRVHSDENFYTETLDPASRTQVAIVSPILSQVWDLPTRPGYVVLTDQRPELGSTDPQPVPSVFGVEESVPFPWQNVAYALQWLLFLGFAGFFYWRWFTDDLAERRAEAGGSSPDPAGSSPGRAEIRPRDYAA